MIKKQLIRYTVSIALLLWCSRAIAQPGSQNFGNVWMQGQSLTYTTTFTNGQPPVNQIAFSQQAMPPYLSLGHANICDSTGNVIIVTDGFNLYDKTLKLIDGGQKLVPSGIFYRDGFSSYPQSSIILPFPGSKYVLVTPTVSEDSFYYNWAHVGNGAVFDEILYDEIDMNANGGAGKVTKRMEPLLQNTRLSKTQMMACRHGDGTSWWLLKQAADTNLVYKFLFTENGVSGPYLQGFSGIASDLGKRDNCGQSMFSMDGTKYATTIQSYGKVFVAEFDRCSGNLSNPKVYKVPAQPSSNPFNASELDSTTTGLSFSPNGRYLYVCGFYNVQQLDLQNTTSPSAWTRLAGIDTTWDEFQGYSTIYPGPDDKLYIGNYNGFAGQMSVIDAPGNKGAAANFCRKCLRFPGFLVDTTFRFAGVSEPPCMPNYALGPATPICYPTGVDELKVMAFSLYPNPVIEALNVTFSEEGVLDISDITGRSFRRIALSKNGGSKAIISMKEIPAGVCVCRYYVAGKLKEVKKITVMHD